MAKDRIESKYVTVAPGVELHVLEKGEGKPLVFIPGLTFSGEIFKNQLEYFSSKYRVIAIDPRGQGYSAKTVDGNDYLTHGRDVAGLIDALTATQAAMSPCSSCSSRKNFSPPISVSSTAYHVPICPSTAMWSESPWIRPLLFCCCSSMNSRTVNSAPVKFSPWILF